MEVLILFAALFAILVLIKYYRSDDIYLLGEMN